MTLQKLNELIKLYNNNEINIWIDDLTLFMYTGCYLVLRDNDLVLRRYDDGRVIFVVYNIFVYDITYGRLTDTWEIVKRA